MENELQLEMESVLVTQGNIVFKEFQQLKDQALDLAAEIEKVEVTDENIKQSKKMLAAVNKRVKELDARRITIKNLLLEPYKAFEDQVKEIVSIVKTADETVRVQVRELEERDREEKRGILKDLFSKRIVHYSFRDLFDFMDFFHPSHLNKSMSIEAVENEMIAFLEKLSRDLKAIETMPDAATIMTYYKDSKDVATALTLAAQAEQQKRKVQESQALKKPLKPSKQWEITVFHEKDFRMVEMFMQHNDIEFLYDELNYYNGGNAQ